MEVELAWSSLLKVMTLGILTYVVSPLLMVIRDSILWWVINKLVFTKRARKVVAEYALDKSWLDCADILPFRILGSDDEQKFYLNVREVTPETWLNQKEYWEKTSGKVAKQEVYLKSLEKRIDRFLHHYKLDDVNPVRAMREKLYNNFCKTFEPKVALDLNNEAHSENRA
ncbi:hypothetical protein [Aeromonas veronii]|uniref:hypothetical protein n=1 Tax=Aeromonas veronii TaxID=654 RepID=UPI003B9E7EFD